MLAILSELSKRRRLGLGREMRGFQKKMDLAAQFDHCIWLGDLNYRTSHALVPTHSPAVTSAERAFLRSAGVDLGLLELGHPRSPDAINATDRPERRGVIAGFVDAVARHTRHEADDDADISPRLDALPASASRSPDSHRARADEPPTPLEMATRLAMYKPSDGYYVDQDRVVAAAGSVREMVRRCEWPALHSADQLRHAQRCGHALVGFVEAPFAYEPTFKVKRTKTAVPADSYGMPENARKLRVPSYCDRVLHHSLPHLEGQLYTRRTWPIAEVTTSDHKPICSMLTLKPTPPPPVRSLEPVTLTFSQLTLLGEPHVTPMLGQTAERVKVRFFASPPGVLVPPSAKSAKRLTRSSTASVRLRLAVRRLLAAKTSGTSATLAWSANPNIRSRQVRPAIRPAPMRTHCPPRE